MRRVLKLTFLLPALLFVIPALSQQVIKGKVNNAATGLPIPAVSVTVSGTGEGTFTNDNGEFSLTVKGTFPITLLVTSVGYEGHQVVVNSASDFVTVQLNTAATLGQEIVVSATRTASKILESPVTIERYSSKEITNATAVSYYDMVKNLKGVDMVNASLTFSSPSTRGFNGSGNLRMNQIVDGMDNQAPGLNFSVGSVIGITQLDVESVELLPGASSALYGPGGMNGALIINSKDPFKYQGFSFDIKQGIMNIDNRSKKASPYYDWTFRWAKKVSDKFAFKLNGQLIQAKDWVADDYRNYNRTGTLGFVKPGTRETDPNYDGVNVYGDETTADIMSNILAPLAAAAPFYAPYVNAMPSSIPVSRTGYLEKDVVDPNTLNVKFSGQLSYKLTNNTAFNVAGYFGTGNTVYTGSDRYSLLNLKIAQYKAELVNKNWFIRGWTTQENAGESFNATVTTRLLNEAWKPSGGTGGWYYQYAMAFLNAKIAGQSDITAHNTARSIADIGRPAEGSQEFKTLLDQVRSVPISKGGGLFVDKTDWYNLEGQYNLSEFTGEFADILVGVNYKRFVLNSEGTLFADSTKKIPINEYGAYLQATKKMANDHLTIIASARYDKNDNFDGRFTPRVSFVIKVAEDNNIRMSYQQAYRFGSTQQQWINLRVGGGTALIGGVQAFRDFYHFNTNPVYGIDDNLFAGNPTVKNLAKFKAETVNSFELGYKGLLADKKLLIDMYGYYGIYRDFITRTLVVQSVSGSPSVFTNPATVRANINNPALATVFSVPQNLTSKVTTYGFGISGTYMFPKNFTLEVQGSSDHLDKVPAGYIAAFNAPKFRAGVALSNTGFGYQNRFGFSLNYKWQDEVEYQGDFASGIVPAFQTLDAQLNYKFPAEKVMIKVGGTNILNEYYRNGFGNATIGGLYYVGVGYNIF
ncbi:MAG: TonB-dependent receptor [Chitinophagaceae bacterium]|nr:TonB-dependent receptor [Chitinophagaceae bacterium]